MIQETSLIAYEKVCENLTRRQMEVYNIFKRLRFPVTNAELAKVMGWQINTITPRVLELRKKNMIVFHKKRRCHATHQIAMTWKLAKND